MSAPGNKRELMLEILSDNAARDYVPAAFFLHFDKAFHFGPAAVDKHLEFFRYTGMDFVKIQYERTFPHVADIQRPEDWNRMPLYDLAFYEPEVRTIQGLVQAAKKDALILVTLYSPFMCAGQTVGHPLLAAHLSEDPEQVRRGMQTITESLMLFVRECIRLGVDGFYASTQGGEKGRFGSSAVFKEYIKPFDLLLMNEINNACLFNILHVCDNKAPYEDLTPFLDYPGHVVNCNPKLDASELSWQEISKLFKRPCMGGMDRLGILTSGSTEEIKREVQRTLVRATSPFILGADCTLPSDVRWENIKAAIEAAHRHTMA